MAATKNRPQWVRNASRVLLEGIFSVTTDTLALAEIDAELQYRDNMGILR
jgi:hypothetical protein